MLVLVGIDLRERRQGPVEGLASAEIASDRDRITGAGVRLRERPAAELAYNVIATGFIVSTTAEPFASQSWRT